MYHTKLLLKALQIFFVDLSSATHQLICRTLPGLLASSFAKSWLARRLLTSSTSVLEARLTVRSFCATKMCAWASCLLVGPLSRRRTNSVKALNSSSKSAEIILLGLWMRLRQFFYAGARSSFAFVSLSIIDIATRIWVIWNHICNKIIIRSSCVAFLKIQTKNYLLTSCF